MRVRRRLRAFFSLPEYLPAKATPAKRLLDPNQLSSTLRNSGGEAQSLMWTAPKPQALFCSAAVAPRLSEVSPVRSLLAGRPPGGLQHDCAAPAQHRALLPSHCFRGLRAGCPAISESGPVVRERLNSVSPPLQLSAPIGRPAVSDNDRWLCRRSRDGSFSSRPIGCGSFGGGRGAIAAGRWSWHSRASYSVTRHEWNGGDNAFLRCTAGSRCWCPWDR